MATFADQFAEDADWSAGPSAYAAPSRACTFPPPPIEIQPATYRRNRRAAVLTKLVETEILPRLRLVGVRTSTRDVRPVPASGLTAADTTEFVRLVLAEEAVAGMQYVETLRLRGATVRSLYLGLLTDAARLLGEFWQEDRCSFVDVTISMGRLQQIVRGLSPAFQTAALRRAHPETMLLLATPGEQHTLGLIILAEFFRSAGWHVAGGAVRSGEEAADIVHDSWFDVAGFSIGAENGLAQLTSCIRIVRRASRNRKIGILIGGPLFLSDRDLVSRVGADIGAADAPSALLRASGLLRTQSAGAA
ncbi:MAG TPA: cobalamin B12-binding domain-containing protein [Acidisphaera sp.]|nr:cobalamin B12-binding domain-containing protein [Acidisphaera sp.]